jgi:hypothetical protein
MPLHDSSSTFIPLGFAISYQTTLEAVDFKELFGNINLQMDMFLFLPIHGFDLSRLPPEIVFDSFIYDSDI